ncbi:MAG: radical SAM protein [Chloroflexota bacterium]|nr:radical SAM protein [Chloroflexota bacterium]
MEKQLGLLPDLSDDLRARPERIGKTQVGYRQVKAILNKASGFLSGYDFSLNPYAGCSFGCTYCYAIRFSGREDAETSWGQWVDVKENAISLMRKIPAGKLDGKRIYMSSVTDPYQSVERRVQLTRSLLEVLAEKHAPLLVVQTRSPDVVRDIDLFGEIEARGGRVQINMTVTTDDEGVRRVFEPGCPSNAVRLKAIADVHAAGLQSCITMTPLLPVADADGFADSLARTGVSRFIIQPFHTGQAQFAAGTRQMAMSLMAERFGGDKGDVVRQHQRHYEVVKSALTRWLGDIGEGRDGFAPPF